MKNAQNLKTLGFTIYEMIMVVGILGIVTVMAFPDITQVFKTQKRQLEASALFEIQRAMEIYTQQNGVLPDDTNPTTESWAAELAEFSTLSTQQILLDVNGITRTYVNESDVIRYRAASPTVDYAIVLSYGRDKCYNDGPDNGAAPVCLGDVAPAVINSYDDIRTNGVLPDFASAADYAAFNTAGDDQVAKFTTLATKVKQYEETEHRLEAISLALAAYSARHFALAQEAIVGTDNPASYIFYPPSDGSWGAGARDDALYGNDLAFTDVASVPYTAVLDDTDNFFGAGNAVYNDDANDQTRYDDMQALMRLLGLPESYCCTPLQRFDPGGGLELLEMPFFYDSNPDPDSVGCSGRPGIGERHLPPKVSLDIIPCN